MIDRMEKLIQLIKELVREKFYGELVIKFECGQIVLCRKNESIKIG
jgi:hypothetical protein